MEPGIRRNRIVWERASEKYVREYQELLKRARNQSSLLASELDLLRPLLVPLPAVVHLQSGHGLDDIALVAAGARSVTGVDFSMVAAAAAQRRRTSWGRTATMWSPSCRVLPCVTGAPTWFTPAREH
jgi:hypothetical protein